MAQTNPLKWPSFEQLGREFHECLWPALEQLASGCEALDDEATKGLARLEDWLSAPCVATVKLDGANVGVDNAGLVVGRNQVVEQGQSYQKTDVWTLLEGYPEKAELFRAELQRLSGREAIAQAMLYGELCVNGKYDYTKAGIVKGWLCFGAVLRLGAEAEDDEAARRLSEQLRARGYNAKPLLGAVLVAPSAELESLLRRLGVPSVLGGYRPAGVTEEQWAAHDGQGRLPRFASMRQLLVSDWAQRLLLPADGVPLCEGLVVSSEADGTLFKWKRAGEELGKVPEQLDAIVRQLRGLGHHRLLPEGLLEVCERLLLVATAKPKDGRPEKGAKEAQQPAEDTEALAVWESALTKFEALEEVFQRGKPATEARQSELIEQVTQDLVKDHSAKEGEALKRATKVVRSQVGRRFGAWRKAQSDGGA